MRILILLCALKKMPAGTAIRQKRQNAILEILSHQPVVRQTQLVALLQEKGIDATQSSVSRDLKQLGIAKLDQGYSEPEPVSINNQWDMTLLSEFVREIETAGTSLTVIKTAVGAAQRVAVYLDRADWPEIVGTISGDDTIFVATRNAAEQRRLVAKLRTQFGD